MSKNELGVDTEELHEDYEESSDEHAEGTEHEDDGHDSAAEEAAKAKKSKMTKIAIIAGGLLVGAGAIGVNVVMPMLNPPPPKQTRVVKPLPPEAPVAPAATPAAPVAPVAPVASTVPPVMPSVTPTAPAVPAGIPDLSVKGPDGAAAVSINGGNVSVTPAAVSAAISTTAPATVTTTVPTTAPTTVTPDLSVKDPKPVVNVNVGAATPAATATAPAVPAAGAETIAPLNMGQTPSNDSVGKAVEALSRRMDDMERAMREMGSGGQTQKAIEALQARLEKLEAKVDGRPAHVKSATSVQQRPLRKQSVKAHDEAPAVASLPAEKDVEAKQISAEKEDVTLFQREEKVEVKAEAKQKPYVLQAVIPGRVWVKTAEGASLTFAEGEVLPDGAKLLKIDADRGRVSTSKGLVE